MIILGSWLLVIGVLTLYLWLENPEVPFNHTLSFATIYGSAAVGFLYLLLG